MLAVAERPAEYQERALAALWMRAHTLADALVTEAGEFLRVIYPGRPSSRAGPDFRDAVLLTGDGSKVTGDVELHTTAPGWYSHGHDTDPNYNGVVLHVVFSPKGRTDTRQQSGAHSPVLALESHALFLEEAEQDSPSGLHLIDSLRNSTDIGSVLDAAGDRRFFGRSHGFALDIARSSPAETLYCGVMEALGFASNRKPFRKLARLVPYATLAQLQAEPPTTRLLAVKAALLGASGLMQHVPHDEGSAQLQRIWSRLRYAEPLDKDDWHLFRVRPPNHPARRIIGAALIVDGCLERGIVESMESELVHGGLTALRTTIEHRPYVGRSRTLDILINIALPFLHAYSQETGSEELEQKALDAYAKAPKLQENEITREMRRLCGIDRSVKLTARRQQGLIHLYKRAVAAGQTGP